MDDPIVSVAEIQRRAKAAFDARLPITACPFNWSEYGAYVTWRDEYKRLEKLREVAPA